MGEGARPGSSGGPLLGVNEKRLLAPRLGRPAGAAGAGALSIAAVAAPAPKLLPPPKVLLLLLPVPKEGALQPKLKLTLGADAPSPGALGEGRSLGSWPDGALDTWLRWEVAFGALSEGWRGAGARMLSVSVSGTTAATCPSVATAAPLVVDGRLKPPKAEAGDAAAEAMMPKPETGMAAAGAAAGAGAGAGGAAGAEAGAAEAPKEKPELALAAAGAAAAGIGAAEAPKEKPELALAAAGAAAAGMGAAEAPQEKPELEAAGAWVGAGDGVKPKPKPGLGAAAGGRARFAGVAAAPPSPQAKGEAPAPRRTSNGEGTELNGAVDGAPATRRDSPVPNRAVDDPLGAPIGDWSMAERMGGRPAAERAAVGGTPSSPSTARSVAPGGTSRAAAPSKTGRPVGRPAAAAASGLDESETGGTSSISSVRRIRCAAWHEAVLVASGAAPYRAATDERRAAFRAGISLPAVPDGGCGSSPDGEPAGAAATALSAGA